MRGEFGIPYPFGPTHLNVKTLAAVAYGWSREVGMGEALKRMGLPLEGTHHRGGDDAWKSPRYWASCFGQVVGVC